MLWQPSNKLLRYFLRRFVSHSLWGCCQFGDCSMKSLPFDISLSLRLLFTCHLLITSWSFLQKLRQGCFDNHQINCWDTVCGDLWAIRSEAVVSLEIVQFPFFFPPHMFHFRRHLETYLRIQWEKASIAPLDSPFFPRSRRYAWPRAYLPRFLRGRKWDTIEPWRSWGQAPAVVLVGESALGFYHLGIKMTQPLWLKIIGIGWNWVLHLYYPPCENLVKEEFPFMKASW